MAQSKKDEFEKTVDKEVKKGINDQNEHSELYHSDDDSLMHDFNGIGENTPFGGYPASGKHTSGPNLFLPNEDEAIF